MVDAKISANKQQDIYIVFRFLPEEYLLLTKGKS